MKIPIRNIYFLLCYAWDRLEEGKLTQVAADEAHDLTELFARVLESGARHLLRRGLDRTYIPHEEAIRGVRGKIDMGVTSKGLLLLRGEVHCHFDELNHDILPNQILRTTMRNLMRVSSLPNDLHDGLASLYRRMRDVSDIHVTTSSFRRVQFHRNNRFYAFLLNVCQLVHANLMIEESGNALFRDFVRNERQMAYLFQQFIFNFFKREQSFFRVHRPQLSWLGDDFAVLDDEYLPTMQTDAVLSSPGRSIIIDTKYYSDALETNRFGKRKVRSEHLYQLFSYLKNYAPPEVLSGELEGMLLYPAVSEATQLRYPFHGIPVKVWSVDLAKPWQEINDDLLRAVFDE